jgi:hypothetical protein
MNRSALGVVLLAAAAAANPRPLPFTYPTDSLSQGSVEIEQFVDLSPVRVDTGPYPQFAPATALTTEVEVGITDRLEIGMYFAFFDDPSQGGAFHWDAIKQRARYRFADPGEWPVDVAIYLELAEEYDAFEVEAKVLLQRRLGPVTLDVNLWAEREFYWAGGGAWVLNPTAGVTYQLRPWLNVGFEYWGHAELGVEDAGFNEAFHHFIGPALMVQSGKFWWSVAPYLRLDGFDRGAQPGDEYGRVWIRSVVGLNL